MRVAVTGAKGFLGRRLCPALRDLGYEVAEIDIIDGIDVRHPKDLAGAFLGAIAVFHLAADNRATTHFYSAPEWILEVGARGILNVITEARRCGADDLIVASSAEVYGDPLVIPTPETEPLKIADPANPRFSYAASKIVTEVAALTCGGFNKVQVFRPHNLYGPGQAKGHVIPDILAQRTAYAVQLRGSPDDTRAFCHVDDAVEGILAMWLRGPNGVYHIGNPVETRIDDLAAMLAPHAKRVYSAPLAGSPARRCPDITKMRGLGWEPGLSLEAGLRTLRLLPS